MDPTDEDKKILYKHLASYDLKCAVCGNQQWAFASIAKIIEGDAIAEGNGVRSVIPVAVITCTKCWNILQFAWLKVRSASV